MPIPEGGPTWGEGIAAAALTCSRCSFAGDGTFITTTVSVTPPALFRGRPDDPITFELVHCAECHRELQLIEARDAAERASRVAAVNAAAAPPPPEPIGASHQGALQGVIGNRGHG
jgi:hypothetical protein